jgi:hypothetical protein
MVFSGAPLIVLNFLQLKFRQLTSREKNILRLALLFAVLMLLSNGVPAVRAVYAERSATIEQLRDAIAREQRLIEDQDLWEQRRADIQNQMQDMQAQAFQSGTVPMLTANIQRLVRQYASESGITITSTRLAESKESNGWLMVEQSMSFALDNQSNTLGFLNRLEESRPYLGVTSFSMRHNRNQYTGDITVVGFSRVMSTSLRGEQ